MVRMAIYVFTFIAVVYALSIGAMGFAVIKLFNFHPIEYAKEKICHG